MQDNTKKITLLLISIFFFAVAIGINFVTFPTILAQNGVSADKIGLAFSCEMLGMIIISFFLPKIVRKLGVMNALTIAICSYSSSILLIYFYQNYFLWITIALFMGTCWLTYVITRQSWLNAVTSNEQRGIVLGIFSMLIGAGIALGPVIVSFSGANDYRTFVISACFTIASFFCVLPLKKAPPQIVSSKRISFRKFFKKNPLCFLGRFFLEFQTYFLVTCTVVYGNLIGLSPEKSGLLVTAFMMSCVFDVAVGFIVQKTSPYRMTLFGFVIYLVAFSIIFYQHDSYELLLFLYFCAGIGLACIFVSVFKMTNENYEEKDLLAANSAFQIIGCIGALCGVAVGGYFIEIFGKDGFPALIIVSSATYVALYFFYQIRRTGSQTPTSSTKKI